MINPGMTPKQRLAKQESQRRYEEARKMLYTLVNANAMIRKTNEGYKIDITDGYGNRIIATFPENGRQAAADIEERPWTRGE